MPPKAGLKRATFAPILMVALVLAAELDANRRVSAQAPNNATAATATAATAPSPIQQPRADSLQAHLNQIQQQVQRQLSQFNGLVANAANANATNRQSSNVLDALSNVGRVIHQQISAATNPNHVNIVSGSGGLNLAQSGGSLQELANNRKNEYQPIQMADTSSSGVASPVGGAAPGSSPAGNAIHREQVELLRQEISRRAGQLQQVVASSMDLLKNNGDLIMRNLLAQMNSRLDQAKTKADRIISSEPLAMNEMTVRTLSTINARLNNLNAIIANIVARIEATNKAEQQRLNGAPSSLAPVQQRVQQAAAGGGVGDQAAASSPQLIDTSRIRQNLQQLTQQFAQAINGTTLHQRLSSLRNQRVQQQAAGSGLAGEDLNVAQAKLQQQQQQARQQ